MKEITQLSLSAHCLSLIFIERNICKPNLFYNCESFLPNASSTFLSYYPLDIPEKKNLAAVLRLLLVICTAQESGVPKSLATNIDILLHSILLITIIIFISNKYVWY